MSANQSFEFENENKTIEYGNIKYLINEDESAAGVIGYVGDQQQIHIPRSIKQGANEYNIIRILSNSFKLSKIKSIQFSSDSKLQVIENNSFRCSQIESIIIPSSVKLIGEGAFAYCEQLRVIEIPNDSKLETIDKEAFQGSTIERIIIHRYCNRR